MFDAKGFATRLSVALASDERRDKDIARAIGVDGGQLSRWKNGGAVPTVQYLVPLVRELGVSAHWLLTGEGTQEPGTEEDSVRLQLISGIADRSVSVLDLLPLVRLTRLP